MERHLGVPLPPPPAPPSGLPPPTLDPLRSAVLGGQRCTMPLTCRRSAILGPLAANLETCTWEAEGAPRSPDQPSFLGVGDPQRTGGEAGGRKGRERGRMERGGGERDPRRGRGTGAGGPPGAGSRGCEGPARLSRGCDGDDANPAQEQKSGSDTSLGRRGPAPRLGAASGPQDPGEAGTQKLLRWKNQSKLNPFFN